MRRSLSFFAKPLLPAHEYSVYTAGDDDSVNRFVARMEAPGLHAMVFVMRIVSWNVNGIRSIHKRNLLVPAIETLKPDILCLQETKAEEHQSEVDVPEYEEYWHSSSARKGYSGVAIFTKQKPLSVSFGFPEQILRDRELADKYGDPNAEGRVITCEFSDWYVVNVYTPNAKDDLSRIPLRHTQWDPAFLAYVRLLEKQKPVIFCGDLNVAHTPDDLARPVENDGKKGFTREEREGVDKVVKAGFVDTFRIFTKGNGHYTWWSHFGNARARNVGWRIDYIFVSETLAPLLSRAHIHPSILGSDHCPVSADLDV